MSVKSKLDTIFNANPPTKTDSKQSLELQWNEFLKQAISKGYGSGQAYQLAKKYAAAEKIKYPTQSTFQKYWAKANAASKSHSSSEAQPTGNELFEELLRIQSELKALLIEGVSPDDAILKICSLVGDPAKIVEFLELLLASERTRLQFDEEIHKDKRIE